MVDLAEMEVMEAMEETEVDLMVSKRVVNCKTSFWLVIAMMTYDNNIDSVHARFFR